MATESEQALLDMFAKSRKQIDEIRAKDLQQTLNLSRAHNLSIYLNALGKDDKNALRPHAIEMMIRGLVGEDVS